MSQMLMKFNSFGEDVIDKEKQEACGADQGLFFVIRIRSLVLRFDSVTWTGKTEKVLR